MKHHNSMWIIIVGVLSLVACAKSFDMSSEQLTPVRPEWGVVVGSVLVKPMQVADGDAQAGEVADTTYEFHFVRTTPGKPYGDDPNAERYRLKVKTNEERIFISRLRPGRYLVKNFAQKRIVGVGGDLDLVFESMAGQVGYIGRLLVEVPPRVSRGNEYRFTVENAREGTLAQIADRHAELAKQAVDVPMRTREQPAP